MTLLIWHNKINLLALFFPAGCCWPLQDAASTSSNSHRGPRVSLNAVRAWAAVETKPFSSHSAFGLHHACWRGRSHGSFSPCHQGLVLPTPSSLTLSAPPIPRLPTAPRPGFIQLASSPSAVLLLYSYAESSLRAGQQRGSTRMDPPGPHIQG